MKKNKIVKASQADISNLVGEEKQSGIGLYGPTGKPLVRETCDDGTVEMLNGTENGFELQYVENWSGLSKMQKAAGWLMIILGSVFGADAIEGGETSGQALDEGLDAASDNSYNPQHDFIVKAQAEFADGYNAAGGLAKISIDDFFGISLDYSFGSQKIGSFGDVDFGKTGLSLAAYHPFEFDWGVLNAGLRLGWGSQNFQDDDYPLGELSALAVGAYAKFTGDQWKAYFSLDGGDGSFEFNDFSYDDYSEWAANASFKKYHGDAFWGVSASKEGQDMDFLGNSSRTLFSGYGGVLGESAGWFDKILFNIYNGKETEWDGSHEGVPTHYELEFRKKVNNHFSLGGDLIFLPGEGTDYRLEAMYRKKF
ncbi:MAG: hypothetical protein V3V78_00240 [Candidatus Woesearchaeota archaeon]